MSDIYISFQLRQAVFNTILLIISFLKGKEAKRANKKLHAKMLNKEETGNKSDDSANSVQTIREG